MRRLINYNQVKALVDQGKHYQEIADILKFSKSSIGRFYRKHFGKLEDKGYWKRATFKIPDSEFELLFGSLMRDSCLYKQGRSYTGSITHSIKQKEYLYHIQKQLKLMGGNILDESTTIKGVTYQKKTMHIKNNTELATLYESFYYAHGKKDVPLNLAPLTPRAIAFWYMDDGSSLKKTALFATCSFSLDGLKRLQNFLLETYNIKTIIRPFRHYLYVKTESAPILRKLIEPYIIPTMLYKIKNIPKLC